MTISFSCVRVDAHMCTYTGTSNGNSLLDFRRLNFDLGVDVYMHMLILYMYERF
jgi:hypothetical protein